MVFVASNDTHVQVYRHLFPLLSQDGIPWVVLSLDAVLHQGADAACRALGVAPMAFWPEPLPRRVDALPAIQSWSCRWRATRHAGPLLRRLKADLLVLGSDSGPVERGLIRAAEESGIPSVLIQDGVLRNELRPGPGMGLHRQLKWVLTHTELAGMVSGPYGTGRCTRIAVYGQRSRKLLFSRGVKASALVLAGHPRYGRADRWAENENGKAILFATQPLAYYGDLTANAEELYLQKVMRALSEVDAPVIIKVHPRESPERYAGLARAAGLTSAEVVSDTSMQQLLTRAAGVLVAHSTVALDAMSAGIPVLLLQFEPSRYYLDYDRRGGAVGIRNPGELAAAWRQITGDATFRRGLVEGGVRVFQEELEAVGEESARRIVALLQEVRLTSRKHH